MKEDSSCCALVGRVLTVRAMRRTCFVDLLYARGQKTQLMFKTEQLGDISLTRGDVVEVRGRWGSSKTGERSLVVEEIVRQQRCLVPELRDSMLNGGVEKSVEIVDRVLRMLRQHLADREFAEVLTPSMLPIYNGGTSDPMTVRWRDKQLGFLRVTHEERLLRVLSRLFTPVFQVGPIFKAGREIIFLEAYMLGSDLDSIEELATELVTIFDPGASVPIIDFETALPVTVGSELAAELLARLSSLHDDGPFDYPELGIIASTSREGACDRLAKLVAKTHTGWVGVRRFPAAYSPLYRTTPDGISSYNMIDRTRIYKDGSIVMDLGVNDVDVDSVSKRINTQADRYTQDGDPRSEAREIINILSEGIPQCVGLSMRLDELGGFALL